MSVVHQMAQFIYGNGVSINHYLLLEKLVNMQKFKSLLLHKTAINLQLLMEMGYSVFGKPQHNLLHENHSLYAFVPLYALSFYNLESTMSF